MLTATLSLASSDSGQVATMVEHGGTQLHRIQELFTVFTSANQVRLGVVDSGDNSV